MTISATRTRPLPFSQRGFTLLEVMVTLSLFALLFAMVFVNFNPDNDADKMKKAQVQLEGLAARGHTMAMLHQKPFWLRFERNKVILQGAELTKVDTTAASDEFGASFTEEEEESDEVRSLILDYDEISLPEGMEVYVRRWGAAENEWFHQEKKEDPVIFWNFSENGLCEPVSLKLEIEKSWMILEMDPLTALVSDQTSEIYD